MTSAKLFILGEERELLWIDTNYYKSTSGNGSPTSEIEGGLITLAFVSREDDGVFLHNMTKKVKNETERMEKGEIHFFSKGEDDIPIKKYKFNDAFIVQFSETFYANGTENMQTVLTISPAIQNYGTTKDFIKHWNVSYISNAPPYYPSQKEEDRIIYINGHFYNKDGTFEGKINEPENDGSVEDVYVCDGKSTQKDKNGNDFVTYNNTKLLKENNENIRHEKFANNSYLIHHEASFTGNKETALWIAHTVNNALNNKRYNRDEKTFNALFKTGYSSVDKADKTKAIPTSSNGKNHCFARAAMISVLRGDDDPTNSSYFWDGLDFFTKKDELTHPKFKQYRSVNIVKEHLDLAIDFWSIDSNRAKINKNATINPIFSKEEYALKNVSDGSILNENGVFSGARTNSQNNNAVHESLNSTGFKSGTLFWTTFKI
ncbi:type VI secretion system tube protein TssD [Flavobacterium branchiicola]|uniref:Type VI secretion system tube protein TssD n=1 Tax=Flavobacterium branchiicola TaxID=1114875 RepID=A0ABV9PGP9_9FLAO|nr:type VI secretion system tube protein TssD [Flavobacterium branchiicola]MBS7254680.1 hypothetical protein [Flavobacterium branchiicola]